jgi:hypothetical protein
MTDNPATGNATVRRWQLTTTLRQLRVEAGLTIEQTVAQLSKGSGRWSRAKLSRIENRDQGVKPREVAQLLDVYQTNQRTRLALLELADAADERGWWVSLRRDLPEDFHPILSLEPALVAMRQYETMLIPGLLQTPDYARTLITGLTPGNMADRTERKVIARMARQQILTCENPLEFHVVLEEAILERPVGQPVVMRRQLQRLIEAAEAPNVTIQVIPKSAGPHVGWEGPLTILSLPEPVPDIGYVEGNSGVVYLESPDDVRRCTLKFGILTERALSAQDSLALIETAAKAFT